jgi:hypothetical protein
VPEGTATDGQALGPERLLITHDNCLDGATAALLWGKAFPEAPVRYTEPSTVGAAVRAALDELKPQSVWLVDLSLPVEELDALPVPVRVVDHHETARPLAGRPGVIWSLDRCGAYLLWQELLAQGHPLEGYRSLVTWVDDRDRWLRQDPIADRLAALFGALGRPWYLQRFRQPPEGTPPFTAEEEAILQHLSERAERRRRRALEHAVRFTDDAGRQVAGSFADGDTSELGNLLASQEGVDYALIYNPSTQAASLRGTGKVNLAELAERLGGGGHANAAGFVPPDPAALTRDLLVSLLRQAAAARREPAAGGGQVGP